MLSSGLVGPNETVPSGAVLASPAPVRLATQRRSRSIRPEAPSASAIRSTVAGP